MRVALGGALVVVVVQVINGLDLAKGYMDTRLQILVSDFYGGSGSSEEVVMM